jgi:hypothetical protein
MSLSRISAFEGLFDRGAAVFLLALSFAVAGAFAVVGL